MSTNDQLQLVLFQEGEVPQDLDHMPHKLVDLSTRAIYDSVAIKPSDICHDPLHYYLGMWGKLIILGSVKRQGLRQVLNPEVEPDKLMWDVIFKEVFDRTPNRKKQVMSLENCQAWFVNRIRIYNERFPSYHCYESAIDQLIRHYSLQLLALKASSGTQQDPNTFYWENHNLPSSPNSQDNQGSAEAGTLRSEAFEPSGLETPKENSTTFNLVASEDGCCLPENTMGNLLSRTNEDEHLEVSSGANEANLPCSAGFEDTTMKDQQSSAVSLKKSACSMATTNLNQTNSVSERSRLSNGKGRSAINEKMPHEGQGTQLHAVVEHSVPTKEVTENSDDMGSDGAGVESEKRKLEASGNDTQYIVRKQKTKFVKIKDGNQALLLSLFSKYTNGQGDLFAMSDSLDKKAASKGVICEFTFPQIRKKILSGEIADVESLMNHCRCIAALHVLTGLSRTVPKRDIDLRDSLRKAADFNALTK